MLDTPPLVYVNISDVLFTAWNGVKTAPVENVWTLVAALKEI